jgi:hypothetical protein
MALFDLAIIFEFAISDRNDGLLSNETTAQIVQGYSGNFKQMPVMSENRI